MLQGPSRRVRNGWLWGLHRKIPRMIREQDFGFNAPKANIEVQTQKLDDYLEKSAKKGSVLTCGGYQFREVQR